MDYVIAQYPPVGVSVFLDSIIADLGLSRSLVSLLYMLGTLTGSLSLAWVGRGIDRYGPRRAVVAIALPLTIAIAALGLEFRQVSSSSEHSKKPEE